MTGLVYDLDEAKYHADPALSSSGAKKLLPPSCPALFKWDREHGQAPKAAFDFGRAAHAAVLGAGAELAVVDAEDWRGKAAKEAREQAYAEGKTPVLTREADVIDAMADAIQAHPIASALLDWKHGKPEVSAFWNDPAYGVDRRARFDWLPDTDGGRLIIPDYKTAASAQPGAFSRSAATFGYHMQAAWYLSAARYFDLAEDIAFVFIVQEKTAPYLVTVCELDIEALRIGLTRNDRALQIFADCTASGVWPGYADDVELISLPRWAFYEDAA